LDLPDGEMGSSGETGVTSDVEGSEVTGVEADRVLHVSEVADEERMTIPELQTENSVSSVLSDCYARSLFGVSRTAFWYVTLLVKQKLCKWILSCF
jgi:hypothetical protein